MLKFLNKIGLLDRLDGQNRRIVARDLIGLLLLAARLLSIRAVSSTSTRHYRNRRRRQRQRLMWLGYKHAVARLLLLLTLDYLHALTHRCRRVHQSGQLFVASLDSFLLLLFFLFSMMIHERAWLVVVGACSRRVRNVTRINLDIDRRRVLIARCWLVILVIVGCRSNVTARLNDELRRGCR